MRLSSMLLRNALWFLLALLWVGASIALGQQHSARLGVMVATRDLAVGTTIQDGDFAIGAVSPNDPSEWQSDLIRDDQGALIRGAVVARDILANEPISRSRLVSVDGRFSSRLSDLIPDARSRLVAWPTREVALADVLRGGDLVDITVLIKDAGATPAVAKTVIQRVKVVSVSKSELLLVVPADLVEPLFFARVEGVIEFSLAGANADKVDTAGITLEQFRQRFLLPAVTSPSNAPAPTRVPLPAASPSTPTALPAPTAPPSVSATPSASATPARPSVRP